MDMTWSGGQAGFAATHDVTEQVQHREKLAHYEAIIRSADDAIVSTTLEGVVTSWNPAAERLYGYSAAEILGRSIFNLYPPGLEEERRGIAERLAQSEGIAYLETRRLRKDGDEVVVAMTLSPIADESGRIVGISTISRDIAAQRQAREALAERQAKLDYVLNHAGCILWDATVQRDPDGCRYSFRLNEVNLEGALRVLPLEVPPGKTWGEAFYQSQLPEYHEAMDRTSYAALESGSPGYSQEFRCRRADGAVRWISEEVRIEPRGADRWRLVGVCTDVTDLKESQHLLKGANERLRTIVDSAPVVIVVLDRDGRITGWNRAGQRILGWSEAEVLGRRPPTVDGQHELDFQRQMETVLKGESIIDYEIRRPRRDGSAIDLSLSMTPLHGDRGEVIGGLAILMDVSARRRAEEALRSLNADLESSVERRTAELQAANRQLESFSYSVSHDLQAPLRSIRGFTQMALEELEGTLSEEIRGYLDRVVAATSRMTELVDDLLALAKITRQEMVREPVNLSDLAHGIAADLKNREPDRVVAFSIEDGLLARGDPRLLRVVMDNLIDNAWKYTSHRTAASIGFARVRNHGVRAFCVRDNGVGFEMEYADKVFGAFERLHSSPEYEGTGIGLATVQRIIQRHGGKVWVDATEGEGAAFYFTLG